MNRSMSAWGPAKGTVRFFLTQKLGPFLGALLVVLLAVGSPAHAQDAVVAEPPAAKPADEQPAAKPADQQPAAKPADQQPAAKPADQQPAANPADQQPAAKPDDQQPAAKPADQQPVEEEAAKPDEEPAGKKTPDAKLLPSESPYRHLAPGVLNTIDPMRALEETVSRHDVVGLLAVDPQFDWAKDIAFRHDVWVLKLQFKPMRMIWVDVPQASGNMQRKLIWYMVYEVTNTGKLMHPVEEKKLFYDTTHKPLLYEVQELDRPVRFLPEFLLEGNRQMKDGVTATKVYPDRVIPVAMEPIRLREDPKRKFLTTVEMCREIAVGETLWGVATWEDVDPKIVRFAVYVFGLTNAYRWKDEPGEYKEGDSIVSGRKLYRKTLKLNFWRPGDEYFEHEEEIRYGVPGGVDYEWVYR